MLYSMTGFGKAAGQWKDKRIVAECRSLNSRSLDLNLRLHAAYREKESELRKLCGQRIRRGKADLSVYIEKAANEQAATINHEVVDKYLEELRSVESRNRLSAKDPIGTVLLFPDVFSTEAEALDDDEWSAVQQIINEAMDRFDEHRASEGKAMEDDLRERVNNIAQLLDSIIPFEQERKANTRERLMKSLEDAGQEGKIDRDRFEQELIYYLEKYDITEEKVRLKNHCAYFHEVADGKEDSGRKLNFISQEIGREINTIGSKANHAHIQKIVVQMKDELEKIKEQLANIL